MLVLSRDRGEGIVIDLREWNLGILEVTVVACSSREARLGFEGHKSIPIWRDEVFNEIEAGKKVG